VGVEPDDRLVPYDARFMLLSDHAECEIDEAKPLRIQLSTTSSPKPVAECRGWEPQADCVRQTNWDVAIFGAWQSAKSWTHTPFWSAIEHEAFDKAEFGTTVPESIDARIPESSAKLRHLHAGGLEIEQDGKVVKRLEPGRAFPWVDGRIYLLAGDTMLQLQGATTTVVAHEPVVGTWPKPRGPLGE
jgi:hypothetical protein